jgi:two-component system chemotaxis response regulator CheB
MIVIGASLGGIAALQTVLRELPPPGSVPIAIVLHRQREADDGLVAVFQAATARPVVEPPDKAPIEAGRVYLAPADYHLLVESGYFSLSTDVPVRYARPSIDVLFESASDVYGAAATAVVLTGANQDGADGAARIHGRGGRVIVQDPATSECAVMPLAALRAVPAAAVLSLAEIGALLARVTGPICPANL